MFYGEDVTHVHETGHADFARESAPGIVARLAEAGIENGLIVELGCGTAITARALLDAGHDVVAVDISKEMLKLARERAPEATYIHSSLLDFEIPTCDAVLAISEVLTYAADPRLGPQALEELLERIHAALKPGGLLLFDVIVPTTPGPRDVHHEQDDWTMDVTITEDHERMELTREITIRRHGRRTHETHVARLFDPLAVLAHLSRAGFKARGLRGYGEGHSFRPGVAGFEAVKMR